MKHYNFTPIGKKPYKKAMYRNEMSSNYENYPIAWKDIIETDLLPTDIIDNIAYVDEGSIVNGKENGVIIKCFQFSRE